MWFSKSVQTYGVVQCEAVDLDTNITSLMMNNLSYVKASCCYMVLHHLASCCYLSFSLLCSLRHRLRDSINIFSLFSPDEKGSYSADADENSCTIGSEIYLDVSYLHYLRDAHLTIGSCMQACQVWSALYDGEDPPPEKYQHGVLEEPWVKNRQAQVALKKLPQLPAPQPRPNTELPSVTQLELEWDDSYDVCAVQTAETPEENKQPSLPLSETPKHIQEMRKTAIMLVKGSYIEENEFQDDVMVYDLVAKKDSKDFERTKHKFGEAHPESVHTSPSDVPLNNGLSAARSQNSLDAKSKVHIDCNSNLRNSTTAELGDDLLSQYEELIRTLDTEAAGKLGKCDGESKKAVKPLEDREEDEEMDFTSFSTESPDTDKPHAPFGTKVISTSKSHSVPFTGEFRDRRVIE